MSLRHYTSLLRKKGLTNLAGRLLAVALAELGELLSRYWKGASSLVVSFGVCRGGSGVELTRVKSRAIEEDCVRCCHVD